MIKTLSAAGLLLSLLITGCSGSDPAETYLDRESGLRKSDSLVQALVRLDDRLSDMPLSGDRDVDIVTELIEHHRATIEMNEILVRDSVGEELKSFAERLTAIQEKEIGQMQEFLAHHPPVSGSGRRGAPAVMDQLHTLEPTDDLEAAYISLMKMHLGFGIKMAKKEEERGMHDEMQELAGEIARSGEAMVKELEGM